MIPAMESSKLATGVPGVAGLFRFLVELCTWDGGVGGVGDEVRCSCMHLADELEPGISGYRWVQPGRTLIEQPRALATACI